jgi:hypothetical protein
MALAETIANALNPISLFPILSFLRLVWIAT